ncbi:MAG TPA: alkaline phosphatase family protein [Acidimicrobiia bacterium]|nr:alkaline phosphatase family protein [Acidimicrobiia bacterium]
MKVVFTVLDSLPARHVGELHTPVLTALAHAAGVAPGSARAVMTAATYPNHASFATGARPREHGIGTNYVPRIGGFTPAWELGPAVPTLFDACHAAGRSSAAVVGDQCLIGVMGARRADVHWPPEGEIPTDASRDEHGYLDDADTIVELLAAVDTRPDLVVSQLNAPDTAAHVHGPDSDAALAVYRETDARLATVRDHLDWDDTVWIVVSDHDQETVVDREPIDLRPAFAQRSVDLFALPEGSATVVCGQGARDAARWLTAEEGVEGTAPFHLADPDLEACLAWCVPGRTFGFTELPTEPGTHGGPRTRTQVAVVTGGHPLAARVAQAAASRSVSALDWAPTIATLLEMELPHARGRSLV